jgi:isoleucyl-tRNA synthetase
MVPLAGSCFRGTLFLFEKTRKIWYFEGMAKRSREGQGAKKEHFLSESKEVNVPQMEEKILAFWDKHKIFEKSLKNTQEGKPFTFYDGPPFATGLPHYGHILASTIKDLVPRYQTMNGRFVRRRWGWDCHGLPIEEIVERKLGISGKKQIEAIGIKKFNETCRSMVLEYVSEWRSMIRRIARWVDFDHSYKTMDVDYMESVWWAFKQVYEKGLIYEGRKVLLYCPRCETPVSNFEVAMDNSYKDVVDESVTVKFKVIIESQTKGLNLPKNTYLLAWTTTPWTLPGNVALAVNPDIKYGVYESGDEGFILAVDRAKTYGFEKPRVTFPGGQLRNVKYEPLYKVPSMESEKSYNVYGASFVTTEDGTGIVHTAVVYGEDDYLLGIAEGLPIVPLLDEKGIFNEKAPDLVRGKYFKKADAIVIADLEERGLLFKKESYRHSYPHCWRCGTALYYNAIPAWFINIQNIKSKLLKSNDKEINWFPEHLKHGRYEKSVEAAPDWNISRNRYWGNPIPAWKCSYCEKVVVIGSLDELSKKVGGSKNKYWAMRHGESENIAFDIIDSGNQHFHLTAKGKQQVEVAAKKIKDIDLIFASDLDRTKETAEIIAKTMGSKAIHYDERLREINLGSLSGTRGGAYQKLLPTQEERFEERPVESSESLRDVRARTWNFLKEIEEKHHDKNVLIVSHEDTIWMLSEVALGLSEERTIGQKDVEGNFIDPAECVPLIVKNIPRNDTGEADMHRPYIDEVVFECDSCGKTMSRTPEIFDSWVEAGSMPFAEHHYPFENKSTFEKRFPAQFVAEYIAQTRAWFYVMHVLSVILFGEAPFENVVTTGTILAEDGSKMSKSKGNFPDPRLLIDKYGADSLRFYLMNSVVMQADNLNFSEKGVEGVYRKVIALLINVYKFFETYKGGITVESVQEENILDLWIKVRTEELVDVVTKSLNTYDTVRATRTIQEYIDDLSTWYLRRSRKRKDVGFFTTMREVLLVTSRVIAPIMPFLGEALHAELADDAVESVHLADWPKSEFSMGEDAREDLIKSMSEIRRLASAALARRAELKIKVRQPLARLSVRGLAIKDERFINILKEEVNVKEVVFEPELKEVVELDTTITPELRDEGFVREVARMVQELRQKAGLEPKDAIALMLDLPEDIRVAVAKYEKNIKLDVGAKLIEYKKSDKFDVEEASAVNGQDVWIGLRKL